ncbi:MAG: dehydrogenase [Synechococcaceae cyanobacterium ELA263]
MPVPSLPVKRLLLGALLLGGLATSPANAQTAFGQAGPDQPTALRWGTPAEGADADAGKGAGAATVTPLSGFDPLTGPRSHLRRDWVGLRRVSAATPILVMAGHADSQNIGGSGTAGEAVSRFGAAPMYAGISDELYWNMVVAIQVVTLGQQRGLDIRYYRPPFRTIVDGNEAGTNWSVGHDHASSGGYAMEIHFDAYGPDGIGSGLIPPVHRPFTSIDESLAQEFGGYPMAFRDVLGGPKRGIALLEIGKLEGHLEASLRDSRSRPQAVQAIAERIVRALELGLGRQDSPSSSTPATANLSANHSANRTDANQGSRNRSTTNRTAQDR